MAEQQFDRHWEELHQLEQNIQEQNVKIDLAIKKNEPQHVINRLEGDKVRLVNEKKTQRQLLSNLATGSVLAAA